MVLNTDLAEETIAKYKPILAKPVEETKEEIEQLITDYYRAVIEEDKDSLEKTSEEINSYIELDVPEFNKYLAYCFLTSINEILAKLYGADLELYVPNPIELEFNTFHERRNKFFIEKDKLTAEEVEQIIQYNIEKTEIYSLSFLGYDLNDFKTKSVLPSSLTEKTVLLNSNYVGKHDIETTAKLFYAMEQRFKGAVKE